MKANARIRGGASALGEARRLAAQRGVAIVRRLLLDSRSPLYGGWGRGRGSGKLESFVEGAINAMRVSPDL